jgi:hypothetical protein
MNTNNPYEITFETKCYENDWEYVLRTNYLNRMIDNCNFNFDFKQVIINNTKRRDRVEYYAQKSDQCYLCRTDDFREKIYNFRPVADF